MGRHGHKGIFKDPHLSPGTRALRLLFSRVSGGVVVSAAAARWLTPALATGKLIGALPAGVTPNRWQLVLGSAAAGFGAGVGIMHVLHWTRMKAIEALLSYNGWMFNQKAKSTMLWGMVLKMLVGPGPHRLHDFDDVMPHLPVPNLDETCDRYLTAVEPLLTPKEFERTTRLVQELKDKDGPKLQEYLLTKCKKTKNWLADWWLTNAYLARRDPIALNVNFFMMGAVIPEVSSNPLARSANIIYDTINYYLMIKDGSLPPDMVMNMVPTCMEGVKFMMAATRIPGEHCDFLKTYADSTHIIVLSKGHYFVLDVFPRDSVSGKCKKLNKHEIKTQLEIIRQQTRALEPEVPVGVLTVQNRSKWAKDRLMLQKSNPDILEAVESAIFVMNLAEDKPPTFSKMAECSLAGPSGSRWFDKSLVLEAWSNCAMGGGNMEHSGTDATHFAVMWEHVLQLEEYGPDGDLLPIREGQKVRTDIPPPQKLSWNLDTQMRTIITGSCEAYRKDSENMDIIIHHSEFGRAWMKSRRVSPDGFIQMAIQLTYWRLHGTFTKTYEPASHRLFTLGRTDNINPVSLESIEFVRQMENPEASTDDKVKALKAAIGFQSKLRLEATAGYGCDRHMLGLECAARELGMDIPEVFNDKAYNLSMRLSTSQVPTTLGHLGLDLVPESIAGGFGPVCEDGYGVLYCSVGDDMFNFSISSWRHVPETDSSKFAESMRLAMRQLRDLLDGKVVSAESTNKPANL